MKKMIFMIVMILVAMFVYIHVNASVDEIVIPSAAIRVRVIANSNTLRDQSMKMKVREYIEKNLSSQLVSVDSIEDARMIISDNIRSLESGIQDIFDVNEYAMGFDVQFGDHFFPEKDYRGIHYDEGVYESLVVVIGEAKGDNWWCVLFPPLCLLEGDDGDSDDVEYQFFVEKMIKKIFS